MLVAVIDNIQGYTNIYQEFKSFPEIFLPISKLLKEVSSSHSQHDQSDDVALLLKDKIKSTVDAIETKANEHFVSRRPLQMRKQKPVPIKLLNPKFEEKYVHLFIYLFIHRCVLFIYFFVFVVL